MTTHKKYIYQLMQTNADVSETPFYVGQTIDPERRIREHIAAGRREPKPSDELKYVRIRALNSNQQSWRMQVVQELDNIDDAAGNAENDVLIDCIRAWVRAGSKPDQSLTNMKKGSPNWVKEQEELAIEMERCNRPPGTTVKKHRELLEEERIAKHLKWLREQDEERVRKEVEEVNLQVNLRLLVQEIARMQDVLLPENSTYQRVKKWLQTATVAEISAQLVKWGSTIDDAVEELQQNTMAFMRDNPSKEALAIEAKRRNIDRINSLTETFNNAAWEEIVNNQYFSEVILWTPPGKTKPQVVPIKTRVKKLTGIIALGFLIESSLGNKRGSVISFVDAVYRDLSEDRKVQQRSIERGYDHAFWCLDKMGLAKYLR
jgi:hypothetical protein